MKTISLVSIKGGTGRTTLAANLAGILTHANYRCMAFDLDPQNALGFHFGMKHGERLGISQPGITVQDVADHLQRIEAEVPYLPFGLCTNQELLEAERWLERDPTWLEGKLKEFAEPHCDFAVLDTPAGRSVWVQQALAVSDLAIVVAVPDAASYATVPAMEAFLRAYTRKDASFRGAYYLINQMDSRRMLSRDVVSAYRGIGSNRTLPFTIQHDEHVRESLANQQSVFHDATGSQVIAGLTELASWISSLFGDTVEARRDVAKLPGKRAPGTGYSLVFPK